MTFADRSACSACQVSNSSRPERETISRTVRRPSTRPRATLSKSERLTWRASSSADLTGARTTRSFLIFSFTRDHSSRRLVPSMIRFIRLMSRTIFSPGGGPSRNSYSPFFQWNRE